MSDPATSLAYDTQAEAFAEDWESQPAGTDLHDAVRAFFAPGGLTADIGCGSGRDTAWLAANGFPATSYDASAGLLTEARRRHPGLTFTEATLPDLATIAPATFANVLCETVIMHLPLESIPAAVARLVDILAPGGTLYLTWRVTEAGDQRDAYRRLYAAFDAALVREALDGTSLLLDECRESASSGKIIHRIVARKA